MRHCFYFLGFLGLSLVSCRNEQNREAVKNPVQTEESSLQHKEASAEKTPVEDLIQVASPLPGAEISSPYQIKGKARGTWFFEGDFPVRLFDKEGNELAVAIAVAQGEWMTEDWVEFEASLEYNSTTAGEGILVFEKSNPSDMRELDREFRVEVKIK